MSRKKVALTAVTAVVAVAVVVGLYLFQPWRLWVDETVREDVPSAVASSARPPEGTPSAAGPEELAAGRLITHEHETSGSVRVLRLDDGSRVLRLQDLSTSSGPDLHVWLSDATVKPGRAGWHVFDDGRYVSLGALKGNRGDQNYRIPAAVDLSAYGSVTIWCDRFNVSFGAASLGAAAS